MSSFHQQMALSDLSVLSPAFRCAYCYFLNPARKTRPQAPRLPEFSFERRLRSGSPAPESSEARDSAEDSDAGTGGHATDVGTWAVSAMASLADSRLVVVFTSRYHRFSHPNVCRLCASDTYSQAKY